MSEETTATVTSTESDDTGKPVQIETDKVSTESDKTETESTETKVKTEESDAASDPAPAPKKEPSEKKIAELAYRDRTQKRQIDRLIGVIEKQNKTPETAPPKIEDFETLDSFLDARDKHQTSKVERKVQAESESTEVDEEYKHQTEASIDELFEAGSERYEDFEDLVKSGDKISPVMRDAIFQFDDMDTQADVAYFLGKNRKEASRIFKLDPMKQVLEMGKLAVKVKPIKQASKAPEPISPVGGSKTSSDEIQGVEKYKDFLKKRNKQLGR